MSSKTLDRIIWFLVGVLFTMLTSCNTYLRVIGAGGNPTPSLKGIHMGFSHDGYEDADWDEHPDADCYGEYILIKNRKNELE